jgi:hypothetical protein
MTRFVRCAMMAAILTSAASTAVVTALQPADAAQAAKAAPKAAPKQNNVSRREIGLPINDAVKALQAMDFATALAKIQIADKVDKKTPYEEYLVAKYLGIVALGQPMRDFPMATTAYNRMIASGGVPDAEKPMTYDLAMKLNFQAGDYAKTIQDIVELQKLQPLDEQTYEVWTQAYYQQMDYPNTIQTAKAALPQLMTPKTKASILGMLLNAQAKANDPGYRQTLDQLAMVSTQPEVWGQVMDFALSTKNITDHQLLNVFRLAMRVGTMRDVDYPAMATIDLQQGMATEGKSVLDKGVMAGTIMRTGAVADLLRQANGLIPNEAKILPTLAAEAAKAPNGEIYVKLGESYWVNGQADQAIDAFQKGLAKGGIKDVADAQTTLGIIYMDAGKSAEATDAFQKAEAAGGTGASVAHAWTLFVKRTA